MILGLNGKLGSGKDEAYKRLCKLSPIPVVQVSYAKKLKESVAALLGITLDQIEQWKNDPDKKVAAGELVALFGGEGEGEVTITFREFLQRYGTEAHRDVFGQDFWLNAALPLNGMYDDALYVVTDMRFPNELERVKALGGKTVYIVGPNNNTGSHASETGLEESCDYTIYNTERRDNYAQLDAELLHVLKLIQLAGAAS